LTAAFAQLSQGVVCFLFFLQGFIEQPHGLLQTKLLHPCLQRSIPGDLIMLDRLRRREQAGVKDGRALELLHNLLAFVDHPVDGVANFASSRLFDELENLLEPLDLILGLALVFLEGKPASLPIGQLSRSSEER
jgi:hypothetical protein